MISWKYQRKVRIIEVIKIICDRCASEIKEENIGYIATNWRSMADGSLLGDNPHEEKHFCSYCMKEIEEFVIKTPENVIKTSESVSEPPESVSKGDKSVSAAKDRNYRKKVQDVRN